MTIDPSYEEWQAARRRIASYYPNFSDHETVCVLTEAALGLCPPKPAARCGRQIGSLRWACRRPVGHPDACRPHPMAGDPPTEHVLR
jgi:hypothetical protein